MGYTYCMADIHGESNRYFTMLEKICFKESDSLYIIGDVIDRGPRSVEILQDVMRRPNVKMLLGNHEQMCLDAFKSGSRASQEFVLWRQNGGSQTYRQLAYGIDRAQRNCILKFLASLPYTVDVDVKGRSFQLVHGFPAPTKYDSIWARPGADACSPIPGVTIVGGHTPTIVLTENYNEQMHIWSHNGYINIDCGCGKKTTLRRLACLRLDDMKEFYV